MATVLRARWLTQDQPSHPRHHADCAIRAWRPRDRPGCGGGRLSGQAVRDRGAGGTAARVIAPTEIANRSGDGARANRWCPLSR